VSTTTTLHFEGNNVAEQVYGNVRRIVGFVGAKSLIRLFDAEESLTANPRVAKRGPMTEAITESIQNFPESFPFMTKGVLVGTSNYEKLDTSAYKLYFEENYEGILDGGHNMLAIGLHVLSLVDEIPPKALKSASNWRKFHEVWIQYRKIVTEYTYTDDESKAKLLDFVVPVEILVPANISSDASVSDFRSHLKQISSARNHNVEVKPEALAFSEGLYDKFSQFLDPDLNSRVSWKMYQEGKINPRDLIALAIIPLLELDKFEDEEGTIEPISPVNIYNSKSNCVEYFNRVMSSPQVSLAVDDGTRKEIVNPQVISALKLAADLPDVYDSLYEHFPFAYNASGGRFGALDYVEKIDAGATPHKTRFFERQVDFKYPDGLLIPLMAGIRVLIGENLDGTLYWKTDPKVFVETKLTSIVNNYVNIIDSNDKNPQKLGKNVGNYRQTELLYKFAISQD
jgi:hypothetical protein